LTASGTPHTACAPVRRSLTCFVPNSLYMHFYTPRVLASPCPCLPLWRAPCWWAGSALACSNTHHLISTSRGEGCPPPLPCALCVPRLPGSCPALPHTTVCRTHGRPLLAVHPRRLGAGRRPPSPGPRLRPPSMAVAMGGDVTRVPFLYPWVNRSGAQVFPAPSLSRRLRPVGGGGALFGIPRYTQGTPLFPSLHPPRHRRRRLHLRPLAFWMAWNPAG